MRIYLIRHGETQETKAGILQGHLPGRLTQKGKHQAQQLGKRLADEPIDVIYTSDLARTYDTACEVAHFFPKIPILTSRLLRERSFGIFEGKKKTALGFYDPGAQDRFVAPEGGETIDDVIVRAAAFCDLLGSLDRYLHILIVTHDDLSKALLAHIFQQDITTIRSLPKASLTIIDIFSTDRPVVLLDRSQDHLG